MDITKYDFQDFCDLFLFFKRHPERIFAYRTAFCELDLYLDAPFSSDNFVRKIFRTYYNESDRELLWITNDYKPKMLVFPILIFKFREILSAISREIVENSNDIECCRLLCCATSDLLLVLVDDDKSFVERRKVIIKIITEYRAKYNNDFLRDELRDLK